MKLAFDVYAKVARPRAEVFEAVTDPKQLSAYFTTGGASGPLREGNTVRWKFSGSEAEYPVVVTRLVPDQRIEFSWETNSGGYDTRAHRGIGLARGPRGPAGLLLQLRRLDADALLPQGLGRAPHQPAAGVLLDEPVAPG